MDNVYTPINQTLQHIGAALDAAEAHGVLCAFLCLNRGDDEAAWLTQVFGDSTYGDNLLADAEQQLHLLKNYTEQQLASADLLFMPLLPDDEQPLLLRTQALGAWSAGFLLGLGLAGLTQDTQLASQHQEFLHDVAAIAKIAPIEADNDAAEADYTEVTEYLRIGVINLYEDRATFTKP